jgi:hypothetical protein
MQFYLKHKKKKKKTISFFNFFPPHFTTKKIKIKKTILSFLELFFSFHQKEHSIISFLYIYIYIYIFFLHQNFHFFTSLTCSISLFSSYTFSHLNFSLTPLFFLLFFSCSLFISPLQLITIINQIIL